MSDSEQSPTAEAASCFLAGVECLICVVSVILGGVAFFLPQFLTPNLALPVIVIIIIIIAVMLIGAIIYGVNVRSQRAALAKQAKEAAPATTRRVPAHCPTCGISLKGTEKFCPQCGAALD